MTIDDNISEVKRDIESVEDTQRQNRLQQEQHISRILQNHLQHEATPDTTINFAHRVASASSSMNVGNEGEQIKRQNSPVGQTEHEPKGKKGRPRNAGPEVSAPNITLPIKQKKPIKTAPMIVGKEGEQTKRGMAQDMNEPNKKERNTSN